MLCPFSGVITFARAIPEFLLVAWTMCRSLFLLELSDGREELVSLHRFQEIQQRWMTSKHLIGNNSGQCPELHGPSLDSLVQLIELDFIFLNSISYLMLVPNASNIPLLFSLLILMVIMLPISHSRSWRITVILSISMHLWKLSSIFGNIFPVCSKLIP